MKINLLRLKRLRCILGCKFEFPKTRLVEPDIHYLYSGRIAPTYKVCKRCGKVKQLKYGKSNKTVKEVNTAVRNLLKDFKS